MCLLCKQRLQNTDWSYFSKRYFQGSFKSFFRSAEAARERRRRGPQRRDREEKKVEKCDFSKVQLAIPKVWFEQLEETDFQNFVKWKVSKKQQQPIMEEKKAKMLKFIMGKGHQPSAERLKVQKELFGFNRVRIPLLNWLFSYLWLASLQYFYGNVRIFKAVKNSKLNIHFESFILTNNFVHLLFEFNI